MLIDEFLAFSNNVLDCGHYQYINLIDGIDGLSSGIAAVSSLILSVYFLFYYKYGMIYAYLRQLSPVRAWAFCHLIFIQLLVFAGDTGCVVSGLYPHNCHIY